MSKAIFWTLLFFGSSTELFCQYSLQIQVDDFLQKDPIYLSGDVNNWDPGNNKYILTKENYFRKSIVLNNLSPGNYSFKLTRGNWQTVETAKDGDDIPNRLIKLTGDTAVLFTVAGWKDLKGNGKPMTDADRLEKLIGIAFTYLNTNIDSSIKYAIETYSLASTIDNPNMKARAVNIQGEIFLKLGNIEKALELFNEGLNIQLKLKDSGAISFLHTQIGDVFWQKQDTTNALNHYREAVRLSPSYIKAHPLHETMCKVYCNIGRIHLYRNQYDSAQWYGNQSAIMGGDISAVTDLFWGEMAQHQNNKVAAIHYYRSGANHSLNYENNHRMALQCFERLSSIYQTMQFADSALSYAREALAISSELRNSDAQQQAYLHVATLFKEQKIYDSAFYYQQKALELYSRQLSTEKERLTLNAYFNSKINSQTSTALENQNKLRNWMFAMLGALVLLTLLIFFYRSRLQSTYDRKMKEVEMRALRAQMNPHFIFNCLGSINRYIVKSDTKTASNYLTKFSKLIRLILDNSASDHISLEAEIQTLQLYLDMESLRFDYAFDYEIQKDESLDESGIQIPSMLIQPYVENAIWHGLLQKEEKGKLWIRFRLINSNMLNVEIEDNGIGREKAAEMKSKDLIKQKSYGMQISRDRINLINNLYNLNNTISILDLSDEKGYATGTKIILQIPFT